MSIKNLNIEERFKEVFGFDLPEFPPFYYRYGADDYDGDIPVLTMPDKMKYFPKFDENEHFSCSGLLKVYIKDVLTQFIEDIRADGVYFCTDSRYSKTRTDFNGELRFKSVDKIKPGFKLLFIFTNTNGFCDLQLNLFSYNSELNHSEHYKFTFPDELKGDLTKMPTENKNADVIKHPMPRVYSSEIFETLDTLNDFIYNKLSEFVNESFNNDYIVTVSHDTMDGVIYLEKIEDTKDNYWIAFKYELFPHDVIFNMYQLDFSNNTTRVKRCVGTKFTVKDTQSGKFTFIRLLANDIAPVCNDEGEDSVNLKDYDSVNLKDYDSVNLKDYNNAIDILKDLANVPMDSDFTISELTEKLKSELTEKLKHDILNHDGYPSKINTPFPASKICSQKYGFAKEDLVNHPSHYQTSSGLEARTVINAFTEDLKGQECNDTANVLKYVLRWHKKNGLQDLEKARNYLNDLIDYVKKHDLDMCSKGNK